MNTHRETILSTVVAKLKTAGLPVYRSRAEALTRSDLPAVIVKPGGERATRLANRLVSRSFQVLFEVHGREDTNAGLVADQTTDPAIALVHATLFADKTLGIGNADLLDSEMQEPQFIDGDETRVAISLIYEALYLTNERDITKPTNGAV